MTDETIPLYTARDEPAGTPYAGGNGLERSLNRAQLIALPGIPVEEGLLGRRAGDLLSAPALRNLICDAQLPLDPNEPDLLRAFDRCLASPHPCPEALRVAGVVGRRLGALLLILHRGDPANRVARPEWNDAHWIYWHSVERVIIGGGLLAGLLGQWAVAETQAFLCSANCPIAVERSPYGRAIALVGLARHAPPDTDRMLLFDFGQTAVKRGLATYRGGALVELVCPPPLASPCGPPRATEALTDTRARWRRMAALIAAEWALRVPPGAGARTAVGLCLATHMQDGHPFPTDRGCYGRLQDLAPHLATFMRDDLAEHLGHFRSLAVLHDGLAAAGTRAGEAGTVVLTLGTAIGAGYPPRGEALRPIGKGFTFREITAG